MSGELPWLHFLLQTSDALFPTGAYAHSLGFEEIVRLGIVRDEQTMIAFLRAQIAPALQHQELPYLRFAYEGALTGDMNALCELDREIDGWKLAKETREASAQLGNRRLRGLQVISPGPLVANFAERISEGEARGHHLIVCGIQAVMAQMPLQAALHAYCYQAMSAVCGAALKLIRIGQEGCQRALQVAGSLASDTIERSLAVARADAGWFNPLLEIAAMRHERADERLFIS